MRENFYIFLDIDGVMYDWDYMKKNNIHNFGVVNTFSPESVEALNYLMEKLLVIQIHMKKKKKK